MGKHLIRATAGLGSLLGAVVAVCAPAAAVPFTFMPGAATPPLGGSPFTADTFKFSNNLRSVVQPNSSFVSERIDPVTGFTLAGNTVSPPGFGSAYGLYFDIFDTGFSTPTSLKFLSSTFTLKADPGNQNGALTSTPAAIGFANTGTTGVADDIVLASGTMISGVAGLIPATGARTTHFFDTFVPSPDQAAVFALTTGLLEFFNTTNAGLLTNTPGEGGTINQTFNGGFGVAQFVPEPASVALLCSAIGGLFVARRRRTARGTGRGLSGPGKFAQVH